MTTGHPTVTLTAATDASDAAAGDPRAAQPVLLNQSGFGLGESKRFTAPRAEDGAAFTVTDHRTGRIRHRGTITGGIGDFTPFDPPDPAGAGEYTVTVTGAAGAGRSVPFRIGAHRIEQVSYRRAVEFMSGSRAWFGDWASRTADPVSEEYGPRACMKAVAWRDAAHYAREIPTLVDLHQANPGAFDRIHLPDAVHRGFPGALPPTVPEIVRLIHWGVELLLRAEVNDPQLKEQLAAFVYAYPRLARHIPAAVYTRARDHLFTHWGAPARDRHHWQAFTPHSGNLFEVCTAVGTGKGELPPGHSVWPNAMMHRVALREHRADADRYLRAARDQAAWLVDHLDPADPRVTKGQRQSEHVLITGLVLLAETHPDDAPAGIRRFVRDWARTAVARSANLWDFRRYSDDRWTIPAFDGGGSDDPNETGNVAGFAAPALAAARLLGDDPLAARLRELATAHLDNLFGRNPTGRHASFDAPHPERGFDGVRRGWFSQYRGGAGLLEGVPGALDGSPKNAHYPFDPDCGDIGHTEGWVAFNTAWNASLAWRAADRTALEVRTPDGAPAEAVPADGAVAVELTAPVNLDPDACDHAAVDVTVPGSSTVAVTVVQPTPNALVLTGRLSVAELSELSVPAGTPVTVSYGHGPFTVSHTFTVTAAGARDLPASAARP